MGKSKMDHWEHVVAVTVSQPVGLNVVVGWVYEDESKANVFKTNVFRCMGIETQVVEVYRKRLRPGEEQNHIQPSDPDEALARGYTRARAAR